MSPTLVQSRKDSFATPLPEPRKHKHIFHLDKAPPGVGGHVIHSCSCPCLQELGGNATLLFYMTEEGNEVSNQHNHIAGALFKAAVAVRQAYLSVLGRCIIESGVEFAASRCSISLSVCMLLQAGNGSPLTPLQIRLGAASPVPLPCPPCPASSTSSSIQLIRQPCPTPCCDPRLTGPQGIPGEAGP